MKTVNDLMTKNPFTVKDDLTLKEAHIMMGRRKTRHILVVDNNGKLTGLLSDRDVKKYVSPFAGSDIASERDKATLSLPIGRIMTKDLKTVKQDTSIKECIILMMENSISALPVTDDDGKLIGIITSTNIFQFTIELIEKDK